MVPQCVSCIAASKLFVCVEKKKLETFLVFVWKPPIVTPGPLALCSSQENNFGPTAQNSSLSRKNTESIAGLRIFVAGLEKRSSGPSRVYGTHNPPIYL